MPQHDDGGAGSGSRGLERAEAKLPRSEERYRLLVETIQDYAIFMLDPAGRVMTWNLGAQRIKGYSASEIIGRHFSTFYPPEVAASGWPERELEMASRDGRFEDEGWRVRKDGARFWANVIITALRAEDGGLVGFAKVTRDLTERRRHEEELRQSEERFRLMVEAVRDYAIFMLDPQGRVVSWNAGAERIKGYAAQEIVGRHFSVFYPPEVVASGWPEHELEVAGREGRFEDEGWRLRKDGSRFWASVVITPVHDGRGQLRGFAKVTRDMSDARRIADLEQRGREMTEFLAMLAHELRNPLAPIRNALGVLQAEETGHERVAWARDVIHRHTDHLTRVVDDLLDVGRITSGKIRLQREPLDLAEPVRRAVEASRPLMDERGHRLDVALPAEPLPVDGDLTRLTQVVVNLLTNAAKYTPEGGHVEVAARREDGDGVIEVSDDGAGIPVELLPRVFELFMQGERTLQRAEGGLGVGLTLVRKLVELHGGSVSAASEGLGKGSRFTIRVPLALDAVTAAQDAEPAAAPPSGPTRTVLVVDDNEDSAESMALLLEIWGHRPLVAHSGPEAIEVVERERPDLVLLDIGLPGMDGYEVAQRLKALPPERRPVLAAMTGYGHEDDRRRSEAAGFSEHLVKPVQPAKLQEVLARMDSGR